MKEGIRKFKIIRFGKTTDTFPACTINSYNELYDAVNKINACIKGYSIAVGYDIFMALPSCNLEDIRDAIGTIEKLCETYNEDSTEDTNNTNQ